MWRSPPLWGLDVGREGPSKDYVPARGFPGTCGNGAFRTQDGAAGEYRLEFTLRAVRPLQAGAPCSWEHPWLYVRVANFIRSNGWCLQDEVVFNHRRLYVQALERGGGAERASVPAGVTRELSSWGRGLEQLSARLRMVVAMKTKRGIWMKRGEAVRLQSPVLHAEEGVVGGGPNGKGFCGGEWGQSHEGCLGGSGGWVIII